MMLKYTNTALPMTFTALDLFVCGRTQLSTTMMRVTPLTPP